MKQKPVNNKKKEAEKQVEEQPKNAASLKDDVKNGSYFKEAFDWYYFRYVTPVCDRSLLIFGGIVSVIVLFFLSEMIKQALPLVEEKPIFVRAKDQSRYFPHIIDLKPKEDEANYDKDIRNVDEAVAKYLLSVYIKEREGFDFSKALVEDVNKKFNYIKNSSSDAEFELFRLVMDRDNPESPINFFGQDASKNIEIESIKFIRKRDINFTSKIKYFFSNKIPSEAEVIFTAYMEKRTLDNIEKTSQKYLAKVDFYFLGVSKKGEKQLKFSVNSYKLFKIKWKNS